MMNRYSQISRNKLCQNILADCGELELLEKIFWLLGIVYMLPPLGFSQQFLTPAKTYG